jgi:hypothetical protein
MDEAQDQQARRHAKGVMADIDEAALSGLFISGATSNSDPSRARPLWLEFRAKAQFPWLISQGVPRHALRSSMGRFIPGGISLYLTSG